MDFFSFWNGKWWPSVIEIFMVRTVCSANMYYRAKCCQNRSIRCGDMVIFRLFQDGGRPPSWICLKRIWTTQEEYLVVSITVQNLIAIDTVVSIIWRFQYWQNWGAISMKSQKGALLRLSASFEPWSAKICWLVWPVGEFPKRGINK